MTDKTNFPESTTYKEFLGGDVEEHGVAASDSEDEYEPTEDLEDLPDLYRYLKALDTADTDIDGPHDPPELFTQPEHKHNFNNIQLLKYEVEEEHVPQYVDEFEEGAKDEVLVVGDISLEEIQEEEKRLRDEHIAFQQQELERERLNQQELLKIEENSKKNVAQDLKEKRRKLARKIEIAKQKERLLLDTIHKTFKRAENKLTTNLTNDGANIKTMYGDLSLADGEYGGAKGRRWKLDWEHTPQPVQIKLKCLRGVKDKLPAGRYVVMVSLYNRIGGSVLRWSKLKGQQWGGATLPIIHNGHYFNFEMAINQSVFAVLPPAVTLRPSMVLVFELFLLRGSVVQTDRVVSWGCFPICDNNMDLIEGFYKTPFLRGEIDTRLDKHTKLEELMSSDLDHWMCNLYFEVVKIPKFLGGQKEYEVELQFSSELMSDPEKIQQLSGMVPPKTPHQYLQGSLADVKDDNKKSGQQLSSVEEKKTVAEKSGTAGARPETAGARPETAGAHPETAGARPETAGAEESEDKASIAPSEDYTIELEDPMAAGYRKRPMTTYGSRYAKKERDVQSDGSSTSSDSEIDDEQIALLRMDKGDNFFKPVRGEPGIAYRRYMNQSSDMYSKKMYTLMPRTAILKGKPPTRKLTYLEKLQRHRVSVQNDYKDVKEENRRHFEHVRRQFLIELGLSDPKSTEFWTMIILLVVTFFIRIYVRYIGQWLFLTAQSIPISDFVFLPYTVQIMYRNTLLHTVEEILVVGLGPMTVFLLFALGVLLSFCTIWTLGGFPQFGHKFVICLGFQAMMDPFFTAIVDGIIKSWDLPNLPADSALADFSKLYWLFVRTEGTGLGGVVVTIFIYLFTVFISGSLIYMYFLRWYNNGRMIDIYWRLHCSDAEIYVPYDLEVSLPELDSICSKAEQWRGEEGERRKVSVYNYLWEEEHENETGETIVNKEKTIHLSIHTVHLDGLREMYRHFLISPEGAILEIYADDSGPAVRSTRLRTARSRQSHGSQESLHKVKGRHTVFTRAGFREDTTLTETESRQSTISTHDELKKEL